MKPKINLTLTKPNGHTITVKTSAAKPPTPEMLRMAEDLADLLSGRQPQGPEIETKETSDDR
jgi:hypothetical protein